MIRFIESLRRCGQVRLSRMVILAASTAAVGVLPSIASARVHDYGRDDDRAELRVNVNLGGGHLGLNLPIPTSEPEDRIDRVWIPPVYRTVTDRVWVQPEYRTVTDRVWREPVVQDACDRVWVEPVYEVRDVVTYEGHHRRIGQQRVLVSPGHWEERHHPVVISDGHWENVDRQELVCEGHWQNVERQELVTPGHWEEHVMRGRVDNDRPRWDSGDRDRNWDRDRDGDRDRDWRR